MSKILKKEITKPTFKFEEDHKGYVIGLDEAGCGPWAGPLVAGAVLILQDLFPLELVEKINDSKKLTPSKRQYIFEEIEKIQGVSCFTAIGISSVEEIDHLNIRQASTLAMERAAGALKLPSSIQPTLGLVDGTVRPQLLYKTCSIPKGDTLSVSIALASIIAKVSRDNIMKKLAILCPQYGWERNVGYGTAYHQAALKLYGPTSYHRKSFAPIAKFYTP